MRALGLPPRRPARTDIQRDHEFALAWLVTRLEAGADARTIKTERESRAAEAVTGVRHSADVYEPRGRTAKRWPDLILEHVDGRRVVLEFELTPKGASRLERIIDGYRSADWFDDVWLLAGDAQVARTIAPLLAGARSLAGYAEPLSTTAMRVAPWPGLGPAAKETVEAPSTWAANSVLSNRSAPLR